MHLGLSENGGTPIKFALRKENDGERIYGGFHPVMGGPPVIIRVMDDHCSTETHGDLGSPISKDHPRSCVLIYIYIHVCICMLHSSDIALI